MKPELEAEYREFVAARLDHLGRFAFLLCRDWYRAEDAVQSALTKLYVNWPRVLMRSPDAYARRVIANVLHDERRRHWFWRERPSRRLPDHGYPDPAERVVTRMTVLEALACLPPRQRLAVVLRHWEDLSIEQVAEIMECSPGTVKSQTTRGLQTLRNLLRQTVSTNAEGAGND
jgi:RNA polymerase sigma-70 factor (sigma-E family)